MSPLPDMIEVLSNWVGVFLWKKMKVVKDWEADFLI
jgi:hypothetical protein